MNEIVKKVKPLGRTKTVENRITELVNMYSSGSSKAELKEHVMTIYGVAEPMFLVYWRWLQDEYETVAGNNKERIQDHLNDLDELYKGAIKNGKLTAAKQIKKFIMELEGSYTPKANSLFKAFDYDSIELKIIGQRSDEDNPGDAEIEIDTT